MAQMLNRSDGVRKIISRLLTGFPKADNERASGIQGGPMPPNSRSRVEMRPQAKGDRSDIRFAIGRHARATHDGRYPGELFKC